MNPEMAATTLWTMEMEVVVITAVTINRPRHRLLYRTIGRTINNGTIWITETVVTRIKDHRRGCSSMDRLGHQVDRVDPASGQMDIETLHHIRCDRHTCKTLTFRCIAWILDHLRHRLHLIHIVETMDRRRHIFAVASGRTRIYSDWDIMPLAELIYVLLNINLLDVCN